MTRPDLTVLATNDFLASVEPWPTSYGQLSGATALAEAVDQYRSRGRCVWIDAGDFAQGGPLATTTGGVGGFLAFSALAPDAAVAGNHEFDWGVQHLLDNSAQLNFPLLCANRTIGLPATATISLDDLTVGIVGLTHPDLSDLAHAAGPADLSLRDALDDGLRAIDGVDVTVVAVHHGVDANSRGDVPIVPPPWWYEIEPLLGRADLVVGGHTLGRFIGRFGDTPLLQPWAFGAEIGICEISETDVRLGAERPDPRGAQPEASEIVGRSPRTFLSAPGRDSSLQDFLAESIRSYSNADVGLIPGASLVMQQPPVDGVLGYLPQGDISRSFVERLIPWHDDSLVVVQMTAEQLSDSRRLIESVGYGACGIAHAAPSARGSLAVCMSNYLHEAIETWSGLDAQPERVDRGQRQALIEALGGRT